VRQHLFNALTRICLEGEKGYARCWGVDCGWFNHFKQPLSPLSTSTIVGITLLKWKAWEFWPWGAFYDQE